MVQGLIMSLLKFTYNLICLFGIGLMVNGENLQNGEEKCSATSIKLPLPLFEQLQGKWEGYDVGDQHRQRIVLTIQNKQLHFFRDEDFWFKTTFTLSLDKDPYQLHATIQESADGETDGEVVDAIFKIEQGVFKLASFSSDNDTPSKSFDSYPSHYVLKKVSSEQKDGINKTNESPDAIQFDLFKLDASNLF